MLWSSQKYVFEDVIVISFYLIKTYCENYSMFTLHILFYGKAANAPTLITELFLRYSNHFVIQQHFIHLRGRSSHRRRSERKGAPRNFREL